MRSPHPFSHFSSRRKCVYGISSAAVLALCLTACSDSGGGDDAGAEPASQPAASGAPTSGAPTSAAPATTPSADPASDGKFFDAASVDAFFPATEAVRSGVGGMARDFDPPAPSATAWTPPKADEATTKPAECVDWRRAIPEPLGFRTVAWPTKDRTSASSHYVQSVYIFADAAVAGQVFDAASNWSRQCLKYEQRFDDLGFGDFTRQEPVRSTGAFPGFHQAEHHALTLGHGGIGDMYQGVIRIGNAVVAWSAEPAQQPGEALLSEPLSTLGPAERIDAMVQRQLAMAAEWYR